ncbi:MAG: hypothetical protein LBS21_03495 [Clostridiales bacterium]|nr:hypothetical protein [Clostridiales bacterium]
MKKKYLQRKVAVFAAVVMSISVLLSLQVMAIEGIPLSEPIRRPNYPSSQFYERWYSYPESNISEETPDVTPADNNNTDEQPSDGTIPSANPTPEDDTPPADDNIWDEGVTPEDETPVNPDDSAVNPQTGDNNSLGKLVLALAMLIASVSIMVVTKLHNKRGNIRNNS